MKQSMDYGWLIIGSRFGGSVAALRLSEKGYEVGIVGQRDAPSDTLFPNPVAVRLVQKDNRSTGDAEPRQRVVVSAEKGPVWPRRAAHHTRRYCSANPDLCRSGQQGRPVDCCAHRWHCPQ